MAPFPFDDRRECECSTSRHWETDRQHRSYHRDWEDGLRLPRSLWPDLVDGIATVSADSAAPARGHAHRLSQFLQRECGHDMAGFPRWRPSLANCGAVAYIAVRNRRSVGFALTMTGLEWGPWTIGSGLPVTPRAHPPRQALSHIWVCRNLRRAGLAMELVRVAAEARDIIPEEFAWGSPLSPAGLKLAARFAVEGRIFLAG